MDSYLTPVVRPSCPAASQQGACVLPTRFLQPAVSCSRHASRHAQVLRTAFPVATASLSNSCCRHVACAAVQAPERGSSGLDIQGKRPTSPLAWKIASDELRANKVTMISQQEVPFLKERGVRIIDIRPQAEYDRAHLQDSVNIQFYRAITGWDTRKFARRAGFAFFGIFNGTELNPEFHESIQNAVGSNGAILVCNLGGTLEPVSSSESGMQSRSLMAAYEAVCLGVRNIRVLKGGFAEWKRNGRPYMQGGELVNDDVADDDEEE